MSTETGTDDDVREDAELIAAVRGGDPEATGELYQRHAGAALVVARRYTNSTADAEDVVSDAFAATFLALQRGNGPDVAFRAYLFTVVRRVAGLQRDRARRMEPTDDVASLETGTAWAGTAEEPALEGFERGVVARAFHTLPERWQAVLWHTEVEGLPPAQIAPILGLTANGVAALAYRAREGLRQAYLQMHLNDPLDEGCRSAAGKLGSYVRGGLGTRETAQVEAHLDGCGECRALVLELGDVNHGMRAVIAPLVLGLAGMGALAHLLPVGGGIAAGAAVLAGHGQAGGAAGAAGTGGAAAAGAGGAAATVGGGAAGVGGAATATAGGFAAFIASIPAAAVAVAAGVVVLAGVATAGVMGLLSGPDQPAAIPTASVTSTLDQPGELSTDPAAPAPVPSTQPTDPVAGPTVPPTPGTAVPPTSAPTSAPTTAPTSVPTSEPTSAPTSDSTAPPTTAPTAEPPPAPTAEPTTEPTPEPTTEPSSEPTQEPTSAPTEPPVAPAALSVVLPDAGQLELDAGADSQELTITVANTGGTAASNLTARVDLPDGVAFDSVRTLMGGAGAGFAAPVSSGWTCTSGGEDDRVVLCTLDSLAPSSSQAMVLRVSIGEAYDAGDGSITLSVSGTGLDYRPDPIPVHVRPSPARVTVDLPTKPVTLVRGRTVPVVLAVRNAGGSAVGAAGADAQVTLPLGARWTPADSDWTCHATGENADPVVLACHLPALAAWTSAPLTVDVTAGTSSSGPIAVLLTPSGRSAPTAVGVGYAVVDPARLTVSGDAGVDVRAGRTTAVDVDVTNVGELASELVTVTLTAPEGTSWTLPASVQDWECTGEDRTATCTRDPLAPAGSDHLSLPLLGLPGGTGALGDVAVTATSPGADEGRTTMAVTGVPPVLTVVTDSATLPVQSDRRVQISFSVDVGPDVDAGAVGARILLPSSMQLDPDPPEAQTAGCTGSGQTIVCDLGDVPAGTSVPVLVSAVARSYADPEALIKVTAHAAKDVTSKTVQVRVPATYAGLSARFSERGSLGVTQVGAPLLSCARTGSATAACTTVLKGSGNNNNQSMVALDDAPPTGKRPAGSVSSSSRLDVPPGATIEWAGLYWSANKVASDGWSRDTTSAQLRPPGGTYDSVRDAKTITTQQDNAGRTYYESFADVTDQVRTGGPGLWSVADVAVATSRNDKDPSYFAGWALVVAYSTAGTAESTVTVYDGGVWVGTSASAPQFAFAAPTGSSATVGVVAWEGDAGTSGDQFRLGDRCTDSSTASTALTPTRANGAFGSASNAFDSTATGWLLADAASTKTPWSPPNSLGTDVKAFQRARLTCDVSTLTATTTGDQYLIGAVTLLTEPTEVSPQTR